MEAETAAAFTSLGTQLRHLLPELVLAGGLLLTLLVDLLAGSRRIPVVLGALALATLAGYAGAALLPAPHFAPDARLLFQYDASASFWRVLIAFALGASILLHFGERKRQANPPRSEPLLYWLGLALGLSLMVGSRHLTSFYLAFELTSLCSYLLAASNPRSDQSAEAGLKYVLYGAFASALLLVGLALLFALTGSLYFHEAQPAIAASPLPARALLFAWFWVYAGIAFKIAALPFQFWAPDVYQGAPASVAAGLSVAPKAVGLLLLGRMRETWLAQPDLWELSGLALAIVGAALLLMANVSAWKQTNFRRLLAYSSIAHTGYLLLAVAAGTEASWEALRFYLIVYAVMQLGAFALADVLENRTASQRLSAASGMGRSAPVLAFAATALMASLAGFPPFWGFWAKFRLFAPIWQHYETTGQLFWAAVLLFSILNTVVGLYYYLKLPYFLWLKPSNGRDSEGVRQDSTSYWVALLAAGVLALGLLAGV